MPAPKDQAQDIGRALSKAFHGKYGLEEGIRPLMNYAAVDREQIREKAIEQIKKSFPIEQGDYTLRIKDIWIDEKDVTPTAERNAILKGETLYENVKADVELVNKAGSVVDYQEDYIVSRLPYYTDDHTFIVKGTQYTPRKQLRTKSGVYTRERDNGHLEASFNLEKGRNFRLSMEPSTGIFNMEFAATKIPLYSILRGMGIDHDSIA